MNETNKQARNALNGLVGAWRELGEFSKNLGILETLEDQVVSLEAQKVALGTDVADLGDRRRALVEVVDDFDTTINAARDQLDDELRARKIAFEGDFAVKREAMRRELETLTIQIGDARLTHAAAVEQIRTERQREQDQLEAVRGELAKLRVKLG